MSLVPSAIYLCCSIIVSLYTCGYVIYLFILFGRPCITGFNPKLASNNYFVNFFFADNTLFYCPCIANQSMHYSTLTVAESVPVDTILPEPTGSICQFIELSSDLHKYSKFQVNPILEVGEIQWARFDRRQTIIRAGRN